MERINGAAKEVISPFSLLRLESTGEAQKKRPISPKSITELAILKARFSIGFKSSILGMSDRSLSTGLVRFNRGSMILSVKYHPTAITTILEIPVKMILFKGFKVIDGSIICAADWVKL